jgi:hypothetical protein
MAVVMAVVMAVEWQWMAVTGAYGAGPSTSHLLSRRRAPWRWRSVVGVSDSVQVEVDAHAKEGSQQPTVTEGQEV